MNQLTTAAQHLPASYSRRRLLGGLLSVYAAALIPWALAEPVRDASHGAFLALSAILAGRLALDRSLADRYFTALSQDNANFGANVEALLALVNQRSIDPMRLQALLDAEHPELAALPRKIASAWFLGIVGEGERARCLAFETALNATVVADVLKPPTYAYGGYGSWSGKPKGGARG